MTAAPYTDKIVVIVDAMSSGAYLAPAFRAYGYRCVHVFDRTMDASHFEAGFHAPDFELCIDYRGDLGAVLDQLHSLPVVCILPGTESGVALSDRLNDALDLPLSNNFALSGARRDKALMEARLRDAGLRTPRSLCSADPEALAAFARSVGGATVAKPLKSAGTQGVRFCDDEAGLRAAVAELLDSADLYGQRNAEVMVQERIVGQEYMINSISLDGRHFVTEVWKVIKVEIAQAPVYDHVKLCNPADPACDTIRAFLPGCLDALGIRHGPAHSEVMLTETGPVLIETAARIMGAQDPHVSVLCTGTSHALRSVQAVATPEPLLAELTRSAFARHRHCLGLSLLNRVPGRCGGAIDWARIRELESFAGMKTFVSAGDFVPETTDLFTTIGGVYLVSRDPEALRRDYRRIRTLEAANFYNIAS